MKAVVRDRYGPPEVLHVEQVEQPVPKDDELLVRTQATTVNRTDTGFRSAEYFAARAVTGFFRPRKRILGNEFAGEVEAVGSAVSESCIAWCVIRSTVCASISARPACSANACSISFSESL